MPTFDNQKQQNSKLYASEWNDLMNYIGLGKDAFASTFTIWQTAGITYVRNGKTGIVTNSADAQAMIQSALAIGGKILLKSPISVGDLTIPDVPLVLQGEGKDATTITYTGTGTFLKSSNQAEARHSVLIKDFKVVTTSGLIGIDLKGFFYSKISNVTLQGFQTEGIRFNGSDVGCYFNEAENCIINGGSNTAIGIRFMSDGGGGQAANKNYCHKNRITGCNIGIKGDAGTNIVQGNTLLDNDIEEPVGTTPFNIKYEGDNTVIQANWVESSVDYTTGIYLRGLGNLLLCNKYAQSGEGLVPLDWNSGAHTIIEPQLYAFEFQHGIAPFVGVRSDETRGFKIWNDDKTREVIIGDDNTSMFVQYVGEHIEFRDEPGTPYVRLYSDVETLKESKGLVVKTPDGTKRYRIRVDNDGNLVVEQVV